MDRAASQTRKGLFEGRRAARGFERGRGIKGYERSLFQDSHAVGEELNLGKSVRGKENRRALARADFTFQEVAKLGGRNRVETARRFVEKKHLGPVEQSAEKAKSLERARGEGADLMIKRGAKFETFRKLRNARFEDCIGEVIQPAEKAKIFAAGEARIKAEIAAGVIAEILADGMRVAHRVVTGQEGRTARGDQERGKNAKDSSFSGAIGAEKCHRLALRNFERDPGESATSGRGEGLKEGAPARSSWRKRFLE